MAQSSRVEKHAQLSNEPSEKPLVLTQPGVRAVLGAIITLGPLVVLERAVRDVRSGMYGDALGILCLVLVQVAVGSWAWAYARRKILLSSSGVEVVGVHRAAIPWKGVRSIEAHGFEYWGSVYVISEEGIRIVVDQTLHGWQQFLRRFPLWLEGEHRAMAERAVAELTRAGRGL
jgi:hypothetical protein